MNPDTLKLIEEKVGKSLEYVGTGKIFLNRRAPMAYPLRTRIEERDLIKLQSSCKAKNTVNRKKWKPTGKNGSQQIGKRSLPILIHTSDRGLISNVYKEP